MSGLGNHTRLGSALVQAKAPRLLPQEGGGLAYQEVVVSEGVVDLWIDVAALLRRLGAKALTSKGRTASLADGLIQARVRRRRP